VQVKAKKHGKDEENNTEPSPSVLTKSCSFTLIISLQITILG
jgi:hypothetical protein